MDHIPRAMALALALAGGGCCTVVPTAGKYFDRANDDPTWAFRGFVYAIETRQWDYAYDCLCESSRQEISRWKFEIAIRAGNDPLFHEVPIFDLIARAVPDHAAPRYSPERTRAWIKVAPEVVGDDGKPLFFILDLVFRREAGEWRFDFVETVNHLQREIEHARSRVEVQS